MSANTSFLPNGCVFTAASRDERCVRPRAHARHVRLRRTAFILCILLFAGTPLFAQSPPVHSQGPDLGVRGIGPQQANLNATGGNGTYLWSVVAGTLPPGMVLRQVPFKTQWALFGTATTPGTYTFTLRVTSAGSSTDQVATLRITSLEVGTTNLSTGFVGVPYSQQLIASNGGAAPTWPIVSGSVSGISVSPSGLFVRDADGGDAWRRHEPHIQRLGQWAARS